MSSMMEKKLIKLRSSDGYEFTIDSTAAKLSETIKHMIEDGYADKVIPLPNVKGAILTKVLEYCKKHVEASNNIDLSANELQNWDTEFVNMEKDELFHMVMAADYLNIKGLFNLMCDAIANMIKGKTPEEIRGIFGITNDLTPEEENEIRRENQWAFDED